MVVGGSSLQSQVVASVNGVFTHTYDTDGMIKWVVEWYHDTERQTLVFVTGDIIVRSDNGEVYSKHVEGRVVFEHADNRMLLQVLSAPYLQQGTYPTTRPRLPIGLTHHALLRFFDAQK